MKAALLQWNIRWERRKKLYLLRYVCCDHVDHQFGAACVTAGISCVQCSNLFRAEAENYLLSNALWQKKVDTIIR